MLAGGGSAWEIGVRWGRGSSAQEGLVQEMGFDLGSEKRDRIQQVGMQGEGDLTRPEAKAGEGEFWMESSQERRVHTALAGVPGKRLRALIH